MNQLTIDSPLLGWAHARRVSQKVIVDRVRLQDFPHFSGDMFYKLWNLWHFSESSRGSPKMGELLSAVSLDKAQDLVYNVDKQSRQNNREMKLTTKSEYLLLALIYIARHEKDDFIKIEDICSEYDISKRYLEQLFFALKQNKYLRTKRGARGGYRLAIPAEKITVAEIARLMDGALAPTESVSKFFYAHTPLEKEKKVMKVLQEIRDYIANKLENLTISDLV